MPNVTRDADNVWQNGRPESVPTCIANVFERCACINTANAVAQHKQKSWARFCAQPLKKVCLSKLTGSEVVSAV